jgi:hypothetical protein
MANDTNGSRPTLSRLESTRSCTSPASTASLACLAPEALLLLACCRQRFSDIHRDAVIGLCDRNPIQWDQVFRAAMVHGVAPLVGENLKNARDHEAAIPDEILLRFHFAAVTNHERKDRAASAAEELLRFFNDRAIEVMLIKGIAFDYLVYQTPYATMSSDIDLVFRPKWEGLAVEDRERLTRLIFEVKERTGCSFECDGFEHHDVTLNGILPVSFGQIWDDSYKTSFRNRITSFMGLEDMLIAACINCYRKRYIRLKMLCDVAEILERYPEIDWRRVGDKSRRYRCGTIVFAALISTGTTLSVRIPTQAFQALDVGKAHAKLIQYLFGVVDNRILASDFGSASGRLGRSLLKTFATLPSDVLWRKQWQLVKRLFQQT